ncbi:MAG: phytoene/squalene synthase family protein [Hyphomicrobiaceae bacterium]|nr:phytoene/squalene synthase family protein [Hyphomicrobiaceae bacterium]
MPYKNSLPVDCLIEYSRQKIELGSKSFAAAAKLLPQEIRRSTYMLYSWCRHCDDVMDGQDLGYRDIATTAPTGTEARHLVESLENKTKLACQGHANEQAFQALAVVTDMHCIPERYPLDLIMGLRMDAEDYRYLTINDTLKYCYHVAGVVGVMMGIVMGIKDRSVLHRACDLGIGFQLTNIARDIIQDYNLNRIYIPRTWLEEVGLDPESMTEVHNRKALVKVAGRLLETSELYYDSAYYGLSHLPFRSAWAIGTALKIYHAIGLEVSRRGARAWDTRSSTSNITKLSCMIRSLTLIARSRNLSKKQKSSDRDSLWTMS